MVGTRDTPSDIQDAPDYSSLQSKAKDKTMKAGGSAIGKENDYYRNLARDCYQSSTNWLNAGRRIAWNDSLRAFQGLHNSQSKYLSSDYRYRTRLFRPKTRMMVRMSEAQCAAAFFGNSDFANISAVDDDNVNQKASAEILKALLQYRLSKTIPWFLTMMGGRQDAEVMGIAIAKAYWKFNEKFSHTENRTVAHPLTGQPLIDPETGEPIVDEYDIYNTVSDHPWIDLIAPENFRFDPGADWRNPIATSPYNIELIPMYISDVKQRIKSGEWLNIPDSALRNATDLDDDVTRRSREQGRVPGKDHDSWKPRDFDICWIRENIIRVDGEDMHAYSVASAGELLTIPRPLKEVYLQGTRPYVCGFVVPEAHKTYPSSKVEMVKDLQQQANDVVNLRLDNVKLVLNPRQFVRDGKGIDPQDVRSFQPGKVVMVKDPEMDVKWDRPPDATQSSYQEQQNLDMDFDALTGSTSNASIQANKQVYEAVGNMSMMQGNASMIGEYEQRVWAETFVEPLLTQLVKLEQAYETDSVIIANAGREAKLFQKFGINEITDDLLNQDITVKVNVGLGATNPKEKLQNFMTATQAIGQMFGPSAAMAANPQEVIKEVFSLCGYKDGDRFFMPGSDIHAMMQQMAQSKQAPKQNAQNDPSRLQAAQVTAQAKMHDRQLQSQTDLKIAELDYQKTLMQEQFETHRDNQQTVQDLIMAHKDRQFQMGQQQHNILNHLSGLK